MPTSIHGVHEIALRGETEFDNPVQQAELLAEFTAPSGRTVKVRGFWDGARDWRGDAADEHGEKSRAGEEPLAVNPAFFQRLDRRAAMINAAGCWPRRWPSGLC